MKTLLTEKGQRCHAAKKSMLQRLAWLCFFFHDGGESSILLWVPAGPSCLLPGVTPSLKQVLGFCLPQYRGQCSREFLELIIQVPALSSGRWLWLFLDVVGSQRVSIDWKTWLMSDLGVLGEKTKVEIALDRCELLWISFIGRKPSGTRAT